MSELHCCVCFNLITSDRPCVKIKKRKKRNAAGRRSSAPRLRRTQRRVGSLLPTSSSLYSRRHCGSRNTRFNVGSETKYGEERSAASSVRVSTKRCSTEPFLHRQEMSVGAIKMVVHISTAAKRCSGSSPAQGAATIVCCARRNYLEREQAANALKFLKTQTREREREAAEDAPLLRASFMGNICSSQLTFIQFLAFKCGRSVMVYLDSKRQSAPAPCLAISLRFLSSLHPISLNISAEFPLSCDSFSKPRRAGAGGSIDFLIYRFFIPTVSDA